MATATADLSLSYLEWSLCTSALLPESWVHPDHCVATDLAHQHTTYVRHKNALGLSLSQWARRGESGTAMDRTSRSGALIGADLFRRLSNIQSEKRGNDNERAFPSLFIRSEQKSAAKTCSFRRAYNTSYVALPTAHVGPPWWFPFTPRRHIQRDGYKYKMFPSDENSVTLSMYPLKKTCWNFEHAVFPLVGQQLHHYWLSCRKTPRMKKNKIAMCQNN